MSHQVDRGGPAKRLGVGLLAAALAAGAAVLGQRFVGGDTSAVPPAVAAPPVARSAGVSALGRLEPEDGVYRIAGPSLPSVVVSRLFVDEGDRVIVGQRLAEIDTEPMLRAQVSRLEAELANAQNELRRGARLHDGAVMSASRYEAAELRVRVAEAELAAARAELARARVLSPIDGQVLEIHAREGERVALEGILELGRTDHMFAVAEVYEDDVARVRTGQRAVVTSPALPAPLAGSVDRVGLRIAKQDALGTDPAARKDARVVEVEIRLDDSEAAAALTNLQVAVEILP